MNKLLIVCFCFIVTVTFAQDKAKSYIDTYKAIAIAEMKRTGVPAAISLAQGLVESGCGEGDLCKISNNHFGIKCKTEWTGDRVYHDDDEKKECFRSYSCGAESYRDHSDFLKNREPYAFLFNLDPTDFTAWAKGLKKAGYATEKDYPEKLIKVINDYNLNQYTLQALNPPPLISTIDSSALAKETNKDSILITKKDTSSLSATIVKDTVLGEMIIPIKSHSHTKNATLFVSDAKEADSVTIVNVPISTSKEYDTVKSAYPSGTFIINHTKVIYVLEGTSLLSIANQYNISLSRLLDFNDMKEIDITTTPQLIFLDKKQIKGSTESHIVKGKESLFDISQIEGIRLEKLLEYNKLTKQSKINVGDKILLRPTIITYGLSK